MLVSVSEADKYASGASLCHHMQNRFVFCLKSEFPLMHNKNQLCSDHIWIHVQCENMQEKTFRELRDDELLFFSHNMQTFAQSQRNQKTLLTHKLIVFRGVAAFVGICSICSTVQKS